MNRNPYRVSTIVFGLAASVMIGAVGLAQNTESFRFLATGDVPYTDYEFGEYDRLLSQAARDNFEFILHVGDIKGQREPCTDEVFIRIRDLFQKQAVPVVYTFGDNEWTDCGSSITAQPHLDPLGRLSKLRELFFLDEKVLRLSTLKVHHQSENPKFKQHIENFRFEKDGVLFIVLHIPGSNNNRKMDDPRAMRDYEERNTASIAFLEEGFEFAIENDSRAVALIMHANPDFENGKKEGYIDFLDSFRSILNRFNRPVLAIHGDTHYFRIDKPLEQRASEQQSSSRGPTTILHFTRMEVFGSPDVAGVSVTVNPASPEVFSFEPYFLKTIRNP